MATTVGFIGIGAMGRPMVENLAKAGFAVQSYDRNGRGNRKSAAAAAKGADVLITMLPGGEAVREAVLEALPALARGTIVVDMSSAEPAGTRALGAALEASGIEFMDAPVSGAVALRAAQGRGRDDNADHLRAASDAARHRGARACAAR